MERLYLAKFFSGFSLLSADAQRDAEIVVRLFEIGLELHRLLESGDGPVQILGATESFAQVVLGVRVARVKAHGFAKLLERSRLVAQAAQGNAEPGMRRGVRRFELDSAAKLRRSLVQIAQLAERQPEMEVRSAKDGFSLRHWRNSSTAGEALLSWR